jgi:hypothetical protein
MKTTGHVSFAYDLSLSRLSRLMCGVSIDMASANGSAGKKAIAVSRV